MPPPAASRSLIASTSTPATERICSTKGTPMLDDDFLDQFRVRPGRRLYLADHDPAWRDIPAVKGLDKQAAKDRVQEFLAAELVDLSAAQALLWANDVHALLLIFQAMDAAGKDSTIKHVMS